MSEPLKEYRWGELLEIIKTPVEMKDDDVFPLASIRRRNGGFFHRETKLGRDILTKTLSKAVAGTFAISRMQVVHGACSYVSESFSDSFLSASYTQFQAKSPSKVDIKYLHYFAHTWDSYNAFLMSSHGVHIEKLTFDLNDWLKRKVKLPPLPEQKKIASILTSVDEVIENTQKQIDKLQDLKKATMNELLTKGIGHTEFKDSELGRIPKSWEALPLSDIVNFKQGVQVDLEFQKPEVTEGYLPFLRIENYTQNSTDIRFIPEQYARNSMVSIDDVVMVRYGATAGFVGQGQAGVLANNLFSVTPLQEQMTKPFLKLLLDSSFKEFQDAMAGGAMPALNFGMFKSIIKVMPPLDEQVKIVGYVSAIDFNIKALNKKIHQTQSLKKSLMQDLLTGKVRVTVD
jgi:type I restriction enzyme S subunit